jgi:hypothetical protein
MMVLQLSRVLPDNYSAEPRVHLGRNFEIDVCAFDNGNVSGSRSASSGLAPSTLLAPTRLVDVDLTEEYGYEVLIFDQDRDRQLVAALELVSPANKDRPQSRRAFVIKCAALLQKQVCVSIVDLVTTRHFNLYGELMDLLGQPDAAFTSQAPATYAVTCRSQIRDDRHRLAIWSYPLTVGESLPMLPIWLDEDHSVSLDLEASYEETCRALRIRG